MVRNGMTLALATAALLIAAGCYAQESSDWIREVRSSDQVVVLTRGPVHEAFAQPVVYQEERGEVVANRPPPALIESPPSDKPEGDNVVWVPGYWSWDGDLDDFIWISGCWRAVPPGCSWMPGYWAPVEGGYVWVSGIWLPGDAREIEYLPPPPETVEEGPPGPAASPELIWIPGCWVRYERRYVWRPGTWMTMRADWVWEPAHYEYTPRGYIFVEGHWDYPLSKRGMLFAPIYCPRSIYRQPVFVYSPTVVIEFEVLIQNLFCCPRCDDYYFGDYYGERYVSRGMFPWFEAGRRHEWYDPIYARQMWRHHDDPKWAGGLQDRYERHLRDSSIRPAPTFRGLEAQVARLPEPERKSVLLARPLKDAISQKTADFRVENLNEQRRAESARREQDVRSYREQRQRWESTPPTTNRATAMLPTGATPALGEPAARTETAPPRQTTPPQPVAPREVRAPTETPGVRAGETSNAGEGRRDARGPLPSVALPPVRSRGREMPPGVRDFPPPQPQVQAHTVTIPAPPIIARPPSDKTREFTPPPRIEMPKPDLNVKPRGRRDQDNDQSAPPQDRSAPPPGGRRN